MSAKPTDAGPRPPTGVHPDLTVLLACEACSEELLLAFPRGRARYGAIDCPSCGSSYLFLLEPRDDGKALPSANAG